MTVTELITELGKFKATDEVIIFGPWHEYNVTYKDIILNSSGDGDCYIQEKVE